MTEGASTTRWEPLGLRRGRAAGSSKSGPAARRRARPDLAPYGLAVLAVALTLGARFLLLPVIHDHSPYVLFLGAVMFSAWYGGLGPGLLATILGTLAARYFFFTPEYRLGIDSVGEAVRIFLFAGVGSFVSFLAGELRSARQSAESSATDAAAAHRQVKSILDSITDGFAALDSEFRVRYLNRAAEMILRVPGARLLGRVYLDVFPAAGGTEIEVQLRRAALERTAVHLEYLYPESKRWYEIHAYPSEQGMSVYFHEITERKLLERRLRERQNMQSLGVLAGGIAHDFNNLLAGILGNTSLALEDVPPSSPAYPLLESALFATERAAQLTRQILAYAGEGQVSVQAVDLTAVVADAVSLVKPSVQGEIQFRLNLADRLPRIEADPQHIKQVLISLLTNAVEAIGGRPGTIRIRTSLEQGGGPEDARTAAEDLKPGAYVALQVQDSGCGMDEELQSRIFDPFFTTKFVGRGLGLAAVSGIVRQCGGAVRVASRPGQGSTFVVLFPAVTKSNQRTSN